ncbi:MAG: D-aminoacylase [Clostridiales bacterium]|nr:D-aminoacylase [Clostridiales bacterium]
MYDLTIKNGTVLDGTGAEGFIADVSVKDGKIAFIGKCDCEASEVIDAAGLTVTPGFIDSHSHSDSAMLVNPDQKEKIQQGITTCIAGQCGSTPAPIGKDLAPFEIYQVDSFGLNTDVFRTMGSFLDLVRDIPQGCNIATFVGHSALRRAAMGMENREPTEKELEKMRSLLRDGMEHGAVGVSFGLIYTPSCYSKTPELIELAKVSVSYGGLVVAHIRDEGDYLIEAVEEFISIIRASGAKGVISHHKSSGKRNWGKVKTTIKMIEKASEEGLDIYCDVYPYNASHTTLHSHFIPAEYHTGGPAGIVKLLSDNDMRQKLKEINRKDQGNNYDWIQITLCTGYPEYQGLRIPEIAKLHGTDQLDAVFDMIRDSNTRCSACYFTMCEEDVETVIAFPRSMIGTDSGIAGASKVFHPRLVGTFPRALGRYSRQRGVVSLPEMVRKMTSLPAYVYNLETKGKLQVGFDADICIFDADRIIDRAEFTDCSRKADGLNYVLLNGKVVVKDAVFLGDRQGKVLLRK